MQLSNDTSKNSTSPPYLVKNERSLSAWRANMDIQMFLMFMHVPCVLSLTSQKLKLLVMKPEKEIQVSIINNSNIYPG